MAKTIRKISPNTYAELAEQLITPEEIHAALQKGGRKKAPSSDGIGLEFLHNKLEDYQRDFREAFNRITYGYLFTMLKSFGIWYVHSL